MQAALVSIITWILGSAVAKMLVGAGLTLLTAGGIYSIVQVALDGLVSYFSGLPSNILSFVILSGVPAGMSLIGSAILTRLTLQAGSRIVGIKVSS